MERMKLVAYGKPCLCGPGFCAMQKSVGFYGTCTGSRAQAAPDCDRCGAPHQSADGCWACTGVEPDEAQPWLLALELGVRGPEAFDQQDQARARGERLSFPDAVRLAAEAKNRVD